MEFKVGDKVQHTGMSDTYYKQDGIYEVIEVDETEVRISNEIGNTTWFTLSQVVSLFKHIDEQQPKVTTVKLTQEQARALEWLKEKNTVQDLNGKVNAILKAHLCDGLPWESECKPLNTLNAGELAIALLIGYEVEQTPEEKVLVAYEAAKRILNAESRKDEKSYESGFWWGKINGMKSALDAYGITVKGINDKEK